MTKMKLRVHEVLERSEVNGPGVRTVIWVQGCTLACPGCFNQETHGFEAGQLIDVDELVKQVISYGDEIEGITISGGEPLQQAAAVTYLTKQIKAQSNLSILLFSGFSIEEISAIPQSKELLSNIDVLLAGRYVEENRLARGLIGSSNKTIRFLSDRYDMTDLKDIPACEISIDEMGEVRITGIDPVVF
ncbi:MAG: radical SAM protein [Candidatus Obscuribacterales bacterium]|nr:radical SAM protein [Candidatus Obscuribacterales bacterium]